jgi:hypothetical protein
MSVSANVFTFYMLIKHPVSCNQNNKIRNVTERNDGFQQVMPKELNRSDLQNNKHGLFHIVHPQVHKQKACHHLADGMIQRGVVGRVLQGSLAVAAAATARSSFTNSSDKNLFPWNTTNVINEVFSWVAPIGGLLLLRKFPPNLETADSRRHSS